MSLDGASKEAAQRGRLVSAFKRNSETCCSLRVCTHFDLGTALTTQMPARTRFLEGEGRVFVLLSSPRPTTTHTPAYRLLGRKIVLAMEGDGSDGRIVFEYRRRAISLMYITVHNHNLSVDERTTPQKTRRRKVKRYHERELHRKVPHPRALCARLRRL